MIADMYDTHVVQSKGPDLFYENEVYNDYLSHYILMHDLVWAATDTAYTRYPLGRDLFDDIYQKALAGRGPFITLDTFKYFTGRIKIQIVYQGFTQAAGKALFYFDPKTRNYQDTGNKYTTALPGRGRVHTVPHITIDPSKSCTCEIILPCPTPEGVWYKNDETTNFTGSYAWGLYIYNPLISGTDAATPDINIKVYASFEGLRPQAMQLLGEVAAEESTKPLLSTTATALSNASAALVDVPVIGKFATTFSDVSGRVASFLKYIGFSKPEVQSHSHIIINRLFDNWSHINGDKFSYNLGSDEKNAISASDTMFPVGDMTHMEFSKICAISGICSNFTLTTAQVPGTLLVSLPVTPIYYTGAVGQGNELPPLAHAVAAFEYWHGEITFEVEIICSIFHRGSILIAHDPTRTLVGGDFVYAQQALNSKIVNYSGNTTFEFTVPWRQPIPWLRNRDIGSLSFDDESCNGTLNFFVMNPLKSNGSTDSVRCNVFYRSKDMKCMYPSIGQLSPSLGEYAGQDRVTAPIRIIRDYQAMSCMDMSPVVPDDYDPENSSDIYMRFGGENLMESTKKLSSKLALNYTSLNTRTTPSTTLGTYLVTHSSFGANPNIFDGIQDIKWTYLTWYGSAYMGFRGSQTFSVVPKNWGTDTVMWVQQTRGAKMYDTNTEVISKGEGSMAYIRKGMTNNLDFTVPFYEVGYYMPIMTWLVNAPRANVFAVQTDNDDGVSTYDSDFEVFSGIGEDGVFINYVGFPAFDLA
jgi:hypothetical protein